jgi:hypothetical protein
LRRVVAVRKLPEAEEDAIARTILERVEADASWDASFLRFEGDTITWFWLARRLRASFSES